MDLQIGNYKIDFSRSLTLPKKIENRGQTSKLWILLLMGVGIGFINGFWGGGGGMLCVPALTLILKMPDKEAHATTILIMFPLCLCSFIVYLIRGALEWNIAGIVTGGFVVGGLFGALALKNINNIVLRLIFSGVIIAGGIRLLF